MLHNNIDSRDKCTHYKHNAIIHDNSTQDVSYHHTKYYVAPINDQDLHLHKCNNSVNSCIAMVRTENNNVWLSNFVLIYVNDMSYFSDAFSEQVDASLCYGCSRGRYGVFPRNFVELRESHNCSSSTATSSTGKYTT